MSNLPSSKIPLSAVFIVACWSAEAKPVSSTGGNWASSTWKILTVLKNVTITILAELSTYENDRGVIVDVPNEWKDIYNVRWQDTLLLDNSTIVNKQPIYFYEPPTIAVEEVNGVLTCILVLSTFPKEPVELTELLIFPST